MANKSGMDYAYDFARNAQALKDIIKAAMRAAGTLRPLKLLNIMALKS